MKHFSIFKRIGLTILVCLFQLNVWAQVKQISGTVSDEKGEPLIGVNVSVKGGTNGAITDLEGKFSLNVEGKDVVVFSYIGYITQEIRADDPKIVKVALIEDSETLDEVVVVGYGVMKKSDVTGSISSLKSKDLTSVPTSNVLEAMQGKIAGLDMTKSDGEAGSALNFTLRGNRWFIEMHKHADHTRSEAFERSSRRDAFVIRLSEMYLIAAEAEMLNNNMPMAVKYMNDLRIKRAYPGHEEEMKVSANDMNIDFILDERARELVGEQLRWFDLKRTGKLVEYVKRWNPDAKDNIKDYHILRPIPQTQLDAISNKTDFLQNAGYN